jgi:hypothetical protein
MTAIKLTFDKYKFASKEALKRELQRILQYGGPDDLVTDPDDIELLKAVFFERPKKRKELGDREVLAWGREENAANVCLAAICSDGTKVHFGIQNTADDIAEAMTDPEAV